MVSKAMTGLVVSGLLLAGQGAFADDWHGHQHARDERYERADDGYDSGYEYAKVVDVDPIIRRVRISEPRQECYTETRYDEVRHNNSAGAALLGGALGAAVGNQIGRGDGRRVATIAGAVVGAAIGKHEGERRNPSYTEEVAHDVERCDVRYTDRYEERIDGYKVTYLYNGRRSTTRLPYDPGDRIRVRVDVRPDDY